MFDILKNLCTVSAPSGAEKTVRDIIIKHIEGHCDYHIDPLGNILFEKKGKKRAKQRVMLDAHMDEVGIIVTGITDKGFLRFKTVGGIEKECLLFHRVLIEGRVPGVTGNKPIHLCRDDEAKKLPGGENMYIDIGAADKEQALALVRPGDTGVLCGDYADCGEKILSKALDDRVGCAVLIKLITEEPEYDFCGSFSVCEEVGAIGARTAAYSLAPDIAIILEGTTAADIAGVSPENQVCRCGKGAAVSFMDKGTVYDRALFDLAMSADTTKQVKAAVSGGNNASAVHLSREGVRPVAISVPCRYIHSSSSVCDKADIISMYELSKYMISAVQTA